MKKRYQPPRSRNLSRRDFLKLAAAAGLLAGCRADEHPVAVSTDTPTASLLKETATPVPTDTATPTATASPDPTRVPLPTATPAPPQTPAPSATPTIETGPADLIKIYPDGPSKVVHTRHPAVWNGDTLSPEVINQMLDASITQLTGLTDATESWAALFKPHERIAIKVNTIRNSAYWTHVPLVEAVTQKLQGAGIAAAQIVIFDRSTSELEAAGFQVNFDGPDVGCYGQDGTYTSGYALLAQEIGLSPIVLDCDALINIPLLKQHSIAGVSFAMKNHYGTFDRPGSFHGERAATAIPELNALAPIKDRTRLIIGDVFEVVQSGWYQSTRGDAILMSFDPVAHDAVGLQIYTDTMTAAGNTQAVDAALHRAEGWLRNGAEMGLGTNNFDHIDVVEVKLG